MSLRIKYDGLPVTVAKKPLWKYDYGQTLTIEEIGLADGTYETHFAAEFDTNAIVTTANVSGGTLTAPIPDQILAKTSQWNYKAYAHVYVPEANAGTTIYTVQMAVAYRASASGEEPTPAEQSAWQEAMASLAAYQNAINATVARAAANLASIYSASGTYEVGDYCIYDGKLYRCTTAITTAEAWDSTHWDDASLADAVAELEAAFAGFQVHIDASMLEDGSLSRSKVDASFEATLAKADSAMQPSVYDPNGYGPRSGTDPYSYALARAGEVQTALNTLKTEVQGAYAVYSGNESDRTDYPNLGAAVRGAYAKAMQYANALLADYEPFDVRIVSALPAVGAERTFYLIPKESGNGYDKYWYITDADDNKFWDAFGASSTVVVSSLPAVGEPDVDYILSANGEYQYYKYINGQWQLIAGNTATIVVAQTPVYAVDSGTPAGGGLDAADFVVEGSERAYLDYSTLNLYVPVTDGNDGYTWSNAGSLVTNPSTSKDYYVYYDAKDIYLHFRYVSSAFRRVGNDTYSRDEIDSIVTSSLAGLSAAISTNQDAIAAHASSILSLSSALENLRQTVNNLDTDGVTYYATYGTAEIGGAETENVFTLYEVDGEEETVISQFVIAGGGGGGQQQTTTLVVERITQSPLVITATDAANLQFSYSSLDGDNQEVDGNYTWKLNGTVIATGACVHGVNTFNATSFCTVGTQKFTLTVTDEGGSTVVKSFTVQKVDVRLESSFNDRTTYAAGSAVNFTYTPYGSVAKTVHFILDGEELGTVSTSASGTLQSYSIPAQSHGAHLLECYMTATINGSLVETAHIFKDIIWYNSASNVPVIGCIYRCLPVAQDATYDEDTDYFYLDDGLYVLYEDGSEGWSSRPQLYYRAVKANQYDTTNIEYVVYNPSTGTPTVTQTVDGQATTLTIEGYSGTLAFKTSEAGAHTVMLACGASSIGIIMDIQELDIDVAPVTANLAFDFNPVGRSNSSENRIWVDDNDNAIAMTVSQNFDWANGGYQVDENGNQYFCIKAGTTATFTYKLFGQSPYTTGAHFKLIFKTDNIRDIDTTWMSCLADSVGLVMKAHAAELKTSTKTLDAPYSEGDIIEFEYNIDILDTEDENAESLVMVYEDGVAYRPLIYDATHRLHQYTPVDITFGSADCDVMIYRMKAYTASLTDSNTISNFIADAVDSEQMVARYNRNQIYNANHVLTPESLAAACPWLRVIKIDAPKFTNNKSEKVSGTTIQCIKAGGDPVLDNWTARNAQHSGQGTTSNEYGVSGRNMDLIMNGSDVTLTLGDGTTYTGGAGKVTLTRGSIPNNYFNVKVNIASSENANNALLANRYDRFLPYTTPAKRRDADTKTTMEFVNCAIFIRENDEDLSTHREFNDTAWHFYGIGNIGDSKKTDKTRVNDSSDKKEFVNEILDNTLANSVFDTGVVNLIVESLPASGELFTDYYLENGDGTYTLKRYLNSAWVTADEDVESIQNGAVAVVSQLPAAGLINIEYYTGSAGNYTMYTWDGSGWSAGAARTAIENSHMANVIDPLQWVAGNAKYDSLHAAEASGKFGSATYEFRYEHKGVSDAQHLANMQVWRDMYEWVITATDQEFVDELEDWFIKDAVTYNYLFTERYTMTDNRAKNTFWHWSKVYISQAEAAGDYAEVKNYYTIDDAKAAIHDGYRFDFWDYDNDTALGINNSGELKMPYGKEDIDYQTDGDPASGYIYNGAESVFFRRVRLLLHDDLVSMYQNRESAGAWTSTTFIAEFDSWQEEFPEELWRLDIERKYYRPYYGRAVDNSIPKSSSRFLSTMMNGRKKYHRRQFERDQSIYMGSKYLASSVRADQIMFRCNTPQSAVVTPDYTLEIVPYSDMYLSVMFGNTVPYQVRAKAGETYEVECPLSTMDDTAILIYAASRIQALNDLSACYIHDNDFSNAKKLQTLVIGSPVSGYSNPFLTALTLGNNALLATLDVRGCPNLTGSLNMSYCTNLRTLRAEGTALTGVTFANNGKVQTAYLPSTVASLTMRNLGSLAQLNAELDNLESLVLERGILDSLDLMLDVYDTLRTVRLVGINWTVADTTLLNAILAMSVSYMSGSVNITGAVRLMELEAYAAAWPDLEVTYDPTKLVTQYLVSYVNADGTSLYQVYVDRGSSAPDPVTLGLIATPTLASTDQYDYTYTGWDDIESPVLAARTVTAQYSQTVRTYTVRWFSDVGVLLETQTVEARSEANYSGSTPTKTTEESTYIVNLFSGWDKSTGCVTQDIDVYAVWERAALPPLGKELEDMSCAEVFAVATFGKAEDYFTDKDHIDITLGTDFTFSNVESRTILEHRFFDGINDVVDTNIKLFDEDAPDFTLAIDFEILSGNSNGATLAACYDEDGSEGFRLRYNSNYGNILWGDKNQNVGYVGNRNMVVLRHRKGSSSLYVYAFNLLNTEYSNSLTSVQLVRTRNTQTDQVLSFGAVRYQEDGSHDYYAKGWIHWCKIWYADLGIENAKQLASSPRIVMRREFVGANKYRLAGAGSARANVTLMDAGPLPLLHVMNPTNTNAGGWEDSNMRSFLNTRVLAMYPTNWRSAFKQVRVSATAGSQSSEIVVSTDIMFLAATREVGGDSNEPYASEGTAISFYTTNPSRVKFTGMTIPEDAQFFSGNTDPTALDGTNVKEGDIWIKTDTDSIGFYYIPASKVAQHSGFGHKLVTDSGNITATSGGLWLRAYYWWLRSPYVASSRYFRNVGANGYPSNSNSASSALGVVSCSAI